MTDTPLNPSEIPSTETWWSTRHQDIVMINTNTSFDGYRLKNFYMTNAFQWFLWMIFHFSVVFFFTFQLKDVALVGIFLGIANAIAFCLDIPVGILQRYYSTKKLFIIAAFSQLVAVGIFFSFIVNFFSNIGDISSQVLPKGFDTPVAWFFDNALNWVLILLASACYGLTKEINDISTFGYILSHASPSEYGKILARNNITYGIGSLVGLLTSWVLLSLNQYVAVIILGVIVVGFLAFTMKYFDNSSETIEAKDIQTFTIAMTKVTKENMKEYVSEKISAVDLPNVLSSAKYIFLKPKQKQQSAFQWGDLIKETKESALIISKIMTHMPIYIVIYWTMSLVLVFGFWDTFAATFLIDYLDDLKKGMGYVLLACIAIPALWLQELAGKFAEKVGVKTVAMFGLLLSGGSLVAMGIFSNSGIGTVLIFAVMNSLGYACGMALGQNGFLDTYNKVYAETMGLKEIDANASASPMKILQNAANVIGLVFGAMFLKILGYGGFFFLFGCIILWVFAWSVMRRDEIEI